MSTAISMKTGTVRQAWSAGRGSNLVEVDALHVRLFAGPDVVSQVSLRIAPGEIVGLIGESGSGKTTIACALLGHVRRGAHIVGGRISVAGQDLLGGKRPAKSITPCPS